MLRAIFNPTVRPDDSIAMQYAYSTIMLCGWGGASKAKEFFTNDRNCIYEDMETLSDSEIGKRKVKVLSGVEAIAAYFGEKTTAATAKASVLATMAASTFRSTFKVYEYACKANSAISFFHLMGLGLSCTAGLIHFRNVQVLNNALSNEKTATKAKNE